MNLDLYKKEILSLYESGYGSVKISRMLTESHDKQFSDRSIRAAIKRWGGVNLSDPGKPLARILVVDIETAPLKVYSWRRFNQNIYSDQAVDDDWPILTWSAKWLFDPKIYSMKMTPKESLGRDDERVVKGLWDMIDQCDIMIAHNGAKFDARMMNARFWKHGLQPPSSYQIIDTLKSSRRIMSLPSFKLDDIAKYMGIEGKIKTDFSWWSKFLEGDQEAIDRMQIYNDKDVELLEEVYLSLRPWIKPHPNVSLFVGDNLERCPSCGSTDLKPNGEYYTYVNVYEALRCNSCGSNSRSRKSLTNLVDNSNTKVSLPR